MTRHVSHHPKGPPGKHEGGTRRLSDAADSVTLRKKSLARDRHGKKDSDSDDELIGGYMDDLPARSMDPDRRPMHGGSSHGGKEVRSPLAHDRHGKMDGDFDDEPIGGYLDDHPARSMNPDRRPMHGGSHGGQSARPPLARDHRGKTESDSDDEPVGGHLDSHHARSMIPGKRSMHGGPYGRKEARSRDQSEILESMRLHGLEARAPLPAIPGGAYEGRGSGFHGESERLDIPYGDVRRNPHCSRAGRGEDKFISGPFTVRTTNQERDIATLTGLEDEIIGNLRAVTDTGDGEAIAICKGRLGVIERDLCKLQRGVLKGGIKSRERYIYPDDGYLLEYPPSRSHHDRQGRGRHPRR